MHPDLLRRIALSRARQIANTVRAEAAPSSDLCDVQPGDVLDYRELQLFVAITGITPGCIHALGVRQAQPWEALKELRMSPFLVAFRLKRRWMRVVPDRRR